MPCYNMTVIFKNGHIKRKILMNPKHGVNHTESDSLTGALNRALPVT